MLNLSTLLDKTIAYTDQPTQVRDVLLAALLVLAVIVGISYFVTRKTV